MNKFPPFAFRKWTLLIFAVVLMPTLSACQEKSRKIVRDSDSTLASGKGIGLAIRGFNYTDSYIDEFYVDGQAGGNLYVSGPDGGGGGSVCCVMYMPGRAAWRTKVRWQTGGCRYNNSVNRDGEEIYEFHARYKEVDVQIDPKIADRPQSLEVHFFPNGKVEVSITNGMSRPRVSLNKDRDLNLLPERCPNDKRPAE